jgi:Tfp pilus assembly protein PilF
LNREGAAALAAGDLATAEARVAVALEYSPRFVEAWVNLGLIELRRGNFAIARKHLVHARDLNPDLPAPHHALGLLAEKEGRMGEAERHYRAALHVDPGFGAARANLGRRLYERGALEEAREQFLRLTEVAPQMIEGWVGLVESLMRLGRFEDADAALARAHERIGRHASLVLLEARQMLRREAYAEAEGALTPIAQNDDRAIAASAWAWIGVARLGQGNAEGAMAAAREALLLDEENAVARYAMENARKMRR